MVVVFVAALGMVVDLDFVSAVDGHPGFCGFGWYTDEYPGVIVLVLHLVHHFDFAIGHGTDGGIEKPHTALGFQHAVVHDEAAWPYVLPATQVVTVKKLFPAELLG